MSVGHAIAERGPVDAATFRAEIAAAAQPVVLRGQVADWPMARAGRDSAQALAACIRQYDRGATIDVLEAPASTGGRLFYRDGLKGFNFERQKSQVGPTLDRLLSLAGQADAPRLFIESIPTDEYLPDFGASHVMPLLDAAVRPRIWIGNAVTVQTHYDLYYNIACVVGGRRRFTLFPPEQVANLYPGPLEYTPAGTPLSMVPLQDPDLGKYPRFAEALRHAASAELEPGDALYIPFGWWHHVQSLTPFNALVNYWWNDGPQYGSPYGVVLHAALVLRDLPADQRAVWRALFDTLVFTDAETALGHLTPEQRGLLGPPTLERMQKVRAMLAQAFSRQG